MIDASFWHDRSVLVTGHMGFKGGWLCTWLRRLGARVTGFSDHPPSNPNLFEAARVGEGISSHSGDVRDIEALRRVAQSCRPTVIFHLAAQPMVRDSYRIPVETFSSNVMGTVNILEVSRDIDGLLSVVIVTSDKCYEDREWTWSYREADVLGGFDPYSASKAAAEIVTASYRRSFFARGEAAGSRMAAIASARAGNVIGGGDWGKDQLVADAITAFSVGKAVRIRNPHAVRPWQHVLDCLLGYLVLAERTAEDPSLALAWNFGPADASARPVSFIIQQMAELWGDGARWEVEVGPKPHETHLLRLDSSRARTLLGWEPRLEIAEALQWTVDWYMRRMAGEDMRAATEAQIARYEGLFA